MTEGDVNTFVVCRIVVLFDYSADVRCELIKTMGGKAWLLSL